MESVDTREPRSFQWRGQSPANGMCWHWQARGERRGDRRAQLVGGQGLGDVPEAAEVSKGTPYLYFPSKEALFIALHDEWDCGLADRVDAALDHLDEAARRSPRRVLAAVAAAVGAHVVEAPETCRVLMQAHTLAACHPELATDVRRSRLAITTDFRNCSRQG